MLITTFVRLRALHAAGRFTFASGEPEQPKVRVGCQPAQHGRNTETGLRVSRLIVLAVILPVVAVVVVALAHVLADFVEDESYHVDF